MSSRLLDNLATRTAAVGVYVSPPDRDEIVYVPTGRRCTNMQNWNTVIYPFAGVIDFLRYELGRVRNCRTYRFALTPTGCCRGATLCNTQHRDVIVEKGTPEIVRSHM